MTEYEKLYRKMEIVANSNIKNTDTLKDMSDLLFSWNREEPDNNLPYKPATNVLEKLSRVLEIIIENQEYKEVNVTVYKINIYWYKLIRDMFYKHNLKKRRNYETL